VKIIGLLVNASGKEVGGGLTNPDVIQGGGYCLMMRVAHSFGSGEGLNIAELADEMLEYDPL
jgi:hypothetical protein